MRKRTSSRLLRWVTALTLAASLTAVAAASGAVFIKIDGIQGDSRDADHLGWIEVESYQLGVFHPSTGSTGDRSTSTPSFQPLTFTKQVDKATPKLFAHAATGATHRDATVEVCNITSDGKNDCYFTIQLENVDIGAVQAFGGTDEVPTEQVSLNYTKIEWTYKDRDPKSQETTDILTSFDLATNKAG